jgi:hypothetical protein
MSKIRINDLARELEVKSREILDVLTTVGVTEKKTHSSSLEDFEADLVRKHLRGRSDAAPSAAKTAARTAHGEEEFKTKIDLSHISRPGDVLRALTQQKEAAEHPVARPVVRPPAAPPAIEAKAEAPAAPVAPKAMPPKPATEAPAPPAPRMVTPASVAATYRPPSVVVIPPKAPVAPPAATTPAPVATSPAIAVPPRVTTPAAPYGRCAASGGASGTKQCYADASACTGEARGSHCAATANDHAADGATSGVQGAFASAACAGRNSAASAGTTSAGTTDFSAHRATAGAGCATSSASSG